MTYPKIQLGEVAEIQIGYLFRGKITGEPDGECPAILMRHACRDGTLDLRECPKVAAEGKERYLVDNGEVLFLAKGTQPMGYLLESERAPCVAANHFYILRVNRAKILPAFLVWWINQPDSQAYLQSRSAGSAARLVRKPSLAELDVFLPPLERQEQLVRLQRLVAKEKQLSARLIQARGQLINEVSRQMVQN